MIYARNIFSLRELEDVLLAVNDSQGAIRVPPAHITRTEPAILSKDFSTKTTRCKKK